MANTPNFGWETPDNTDLVKDGAAAMRTLGDAIDASLVDLKGGTSGQVLSKNSNTDMDFVWVTSDDANAIQNAIVDAKGDLISATANDTPARLAVGANETRLVADSAQTTGLKYVADTTNYAINAKGDLLVGTSADTLTAVTVGGNFSFLTADSAQSSGIKWDNDAFTSYTPTITAGSGTFTTVSATGKYKRVGKLCFVQQVITITTNGTAGTSLLATLPFTGTNDTYTGLYRENQSTGAMGQIRASNTAAVYATSGNSYPGASNYTIIGSFFYEVA